MWLFLPPGCLSSRATADSSSDSDSPSPDCALWVTSSGTPTQRPSSWPGWRTRPWRQLLSGTTLPPSTADAGVESWISSLAASRARTSASPARVRASRARRPAFGANSPGWFAKYDPASHSLRTAQLSLLEGSTECCRTLPRAGSMRSGTLFERQTWALRTSANASSSWPTATDANASGAVGYSTASGRHSGTTLTDAAVRLWPTATATAYGSNRGGGAGRTGPVRPSLEALARNWPTPGARLAQGRGDPSEDTALARLASGRRNLDDSVSAWPTPAARDWKDCGAPAELARNTPAAAAAALSLSSRLEETRSPTGAPSSTSGRTLNPLFVEWLQGVPLGWSAPFPIAQTDFAAWATRWCPASPPSRGASSGSAPSETET